ncbi:unnamed protein product, partial [Linum tenue]
HLTWFCRNLICSRNYDNTEKYTISNIKKERSYCQKLQHTSSSHSHRYPEVLTQSPCLLTRKQHRLLSTSNQQLPVGARQFIQREVTS